MRAVFLFLAILGALAGTARAQEPPPSPPAAGQPGDVREGGLTLRDRIVAVIDDDPIFASDIDRIIGLGGLGLATREAGEDETAFRRRVLEQLIEQRLRFHELDRFGFGQVPVGQVETQVAEIRAPFASDADFERHLAELGLSLNSLRQLLTRQLMVYAYVQERLGPRVFITPEDIKTYYDNVLVPEMQRQGQPVPELGEVRERIRAVLAERRLNEEIEAWTEELRQKANVTSFFDSPGPGRPLPPVVRRIEAQPPG